MRFFYLRRKKDGKEFTIAEQDVDGTLKQGFEMVGEVEQRAEAVAPEQPKETKMYQCPICGFQTEHEKALKMHKGRMHK